MNFCSSVSRLQAGDARRDTEILVSLMQTHCGFGDGGNCVSAGFWAEFLEKTSRSIDRMDFDGKLASSLCWRDPLLESFIDISLFDSFVFFDSTDFFDDMLSSELLLDPFGTAGLRGRVLCLFIFQVRLKL